MVRELARSDRLGDASAGPLPGQPERGDRRLRPVLYLRLHPDVADLLLAATLTILAVTGLAVGSTSTARSTPPHRANVLAVVLIVGQTVPLVWRRRRAVEALVVALAYARR